MVKSFKKNGGPFILKLFELATESSHSLDQNFQIFWLNGEEPSNLVGSFGLTYLFYRENRSLHEFCSRGSKFSSRRRNNEINQFNDLKFLIASLIFEYRLTQKLKFDFFLYDDIIKPFIYTFLNS